MITIELTKQVRSPGAWGVTATMAGVGLAIFIAIGVTSASMPDRVGDWVSVVVNSSGFASPLVVLNSMLLFLLPLVAAVFAGVSVAGEAAWGSLRYLLASPVGRTRVLASKVCTAALLCIGTVVAVVGLSLLAGGIAFGWRSLTVIDLRHSTALHLAATTLGPLDALWHVALATGLVIATLAGTFCFAFLLSTMTSSRLCAVSGGVGLWLASRALDDVQGLRALRPWLPATDAGTTAWTGIFASPSQSAGIGHELLVQLVYSAIFLSAAWLWFIRTDVLT